MTKNKNRTEISPPSFLEIIAETFSGTMKTFQTSPKSTTGYLLITLTKKHPSSSFTLIIFCRRSDVESAELKLNGKKKKKKLFHPLAVSKQLLSSVIFFETTFKFVSFFHLTPAAAAAPGCLRKQRFSSAQLSKKGHWKKAISFQNVLTSPFLFIYLRCESSTCKYWVKPISTKTRQIHSNLSESSSRPKCLTNCHPAPASPTAFQLRHTSEAGHAKYLPPLANPWACCSIFQLACN